MSVDFNVSAEVRNDVGKGASRRLRHSGKIPGVMYGAGADATALSMDHDEVLHHLEHEAFYSHILNIKIDGNDQKAVLKDVQRHPSKPKIMHIDFLRVNDSDKIHMQVPLHFLNEESAPAVKGGSLVSHLMTNVEIVCMAKDLPEYIELDLGNLQDGDSLHLSDIVLPEGVSIPALAQGEDHNLPVVNIHTPRSASDEEASEETPAGDEAPDNDTNA